jgi:hypothetical protein
MILRDVILQNAQTVASIGTYISIADAQLVVIAIGGTSTSFNINFEASLDNTLYFPVDGNPVANTSTAVASPSASVLNQCWEFDVPAYSYLRANLTAIANGNITATANSLT